MKAKFGKVRRKLELGWDNTWSGWMHEVAYIVGSKARYERYRVSLCFCKNSLIQSKHFSVPLQWKAGAFTTKHIPIFSPVKDNTSGSCYMFTCFTMISRWRLRELEKQGMWSKEVCETIARRHTSNRLPCQRPEEGMKPMLLAANRTFLQIGSTILPTIWR